MATDPTSFENDVDRYFEEGGYDDEEEQGPDFSGAPPPLRSPAASVRPSDEHPEAVSPDASLPVPPESPDAANRYQGANAIQSSTSSTPGEQHDSAFAQQQMTPELAPRPTPENFPRARRFSADGQIPQLDLRNMNPSQHDESSTPATAAASTNLTERPNMEDVEDVVPAGETVVPAVQLLVGVGAASSSTSSQPLTPVLLAASGGRVTHSHASTAGGVSAAASEVPVPSSPPQSQPEAQQPRMLSMSDYVRVHSLGQQRGENHGDLQPAEEHLPPPGLRGGPRGQQDQQEDAVPGVVGHRATRPPQLLAQNVGGFALELHPERDIPRREVDDSPGGHSLDLSDDDSPLLEPRQTSGERERERDQHQQRRGAQEPAVESGVSSSRSSRENDPAQEGQRAAARPELVPVPPVTGAGVVQQQLYQRVEAENSVGEQLLGSPFEFTPVDEIPGSARKLEVGSKRGITAAHDVGAPGRPGEAAGNPIDLASTSAEEDVTAPPAAKAGQSTRERPFLPRGTVVAPGGPHGLAPGGSGPSADTDPTHGGLFRADPPATAQSGGASTPGDHRLAQKDHEIAALRKRMDDLKGENELLQGRVNELALQNHNLAEEKNQLEEEVATTHVREEQFYRPRTEALEASEQKVQQLEKELAEARGEVAHYDGAVRDMTQQLANAEQELAALRGQASQREKELRGELTAKQLEISDLREEVETSGRLKAELEQQLIQEMAKPDTEDAEVQVSCAFDAEQAENFHCDYKQYLICQPERLLRQYPDLENGRQGGCYGHACWVLLKDREQYRQNYEVLEILKNTLLDPKTLRDLVTRAARVAEERHEMIRRAAVGVVDPSDVVGDQSSLLASPGIQSGLEQLGIPPDLAKGDAKEREERLRADTAEAVWTEVLFFQERRISELQAKINALEDAKRVAERRVQVGTEWKERTRHADAEKFVKDYIGTISELKRQLRSAYAADAPAREPPALVSTGVDGFKDLASPVEVSCPQGQAAGDEPQEKRREGGEQQQHDSTGNAAGRSSGPTAAGPRASAAWEIHLRTKLKQACFEIGELAKRHALLQEERDQLYADKLELTHETKQTQAALSLHLRQGTGAQVGGAGAGLAIMQPGSGVVARGGAPPRWSDPHHSAGGTTSVPSGRAYSWTTAAEPRITNYKPTPRHASTLTPPPSVEDRFDNYSIHKTSQPPGKKALPQHAGKRRPLYNAK